MGAVTETGDAYLDEMVLQSLRVPKEYIQKKVAEETKKAQERLALFRKNKPPRILKGKTIILVDDGLATGSTMKAAIVSLRAEKAKSVIAAVPVSPLETAGEITLLADKFVCLAVERNFYAVGQFYQDFGETTNEDVLRLLA
jgi:putative phosphoribosyl transferase